MVLRRDIKQIILNWINENSFFSLIYIFSSPIFADSISDFQIEGISLGDKALDYFSKFELNNSIDAQNYKIMSLNIIFSNIQNQKLTNLFKSQLNRAIKVLKSMGYKVIFFIKI